MALFFGCAEPEDTKQKSVFIIVDGISADILESTETPNIDRIIADGSYALGWLGGIKGAYSESPTISAVGYSHIITGVWSNKHNVYNNDIEEPNYNYWNIFRQFKHQYPEKSVAIYSSWLDNRLKLVGEGIPEAGNIYIDIHHDGFELDTLAFPHEYGYIQRIDEHVANLAASSIKEDAPYLSWVYLWYPDETGHFYGETEEHINSIKIADEQIGKIYDAVRYRMENYDEEWLFIVTTDHGRRLPDGRDHGGQSDRERKIWFVVNQPEMNQVFREGFPPVTSIYPTIADHLGLYITPEHQKELDGLPLIGAVSISDPNVSYQVDNNIIDIEWIPWDEEGDVHIHVALTNNFSSGENDEYMHVKTVPLSAKSTSIDVSEMPSQFYKIALVAPYNTVNRWIVLQEP